MKCVLQRLNPKALRAREILGSANPQPQYSGSIRPTTHMDSFSRCITASGTNCSNRWTYRLCIMKNLPRGCSRRVRAALRSAGAPVMSFRGGLLFKTHRLLYQSTLGLRVIRKKNKVWGFVSCFRFSGMIMALGCPECSERVPRGCSRRERAAPRLAGVPQRARRAPPGALRALPASQSNWSNLSHTGQISRNLTIM